MTSGIRFLSVDEALATHARLLEEFGGPEGVRDLGSLESALFRSRTGEYHDFAAMAAALLESLLTNHGAGPGVAARGAVRPVPSSGRSAAPMR